MIVFLSSGWFAVRLYKVDSAPLTAELVILFLWKQADKVKVVVLQSSNLLPQTFSYLGTAEEQ